MNEHKSYIFFDQSGNPLYCFVPGSPEDVQNELYGPLSSIVEIPEALQNTSHDYILESVYRKEGAIKVRPPRPAWHDWDSASESWLPNLDAAREGQLQEVAAELNMRLYLPCNGFDADKVSRERISGMISRLQRGEGLPTGWVGWRDASNQQQWASDNATTVLANLISLSRAIEEREQSLLVKGWQHKAAIAALEGVNSIINYDTSSGW